MKTFLFLTYLAFSYANNPPPGPLGPIGAIEKFDLLEDFPGAKLGAFESVDCDFPSDFQVCTHVNAYQDPTTEQITIIAERGTNDRIYMAR